MSDKQKLSKNKKESKSYNKKTLLIIALSIIVLVLGASLAFFIAKLYPNVEEVEKSEDETQSSSDEGYYSYPDENQIVETEKWSSVAINEVVIVLEEDSEKSDAAEIAKNIGADIVGEFPYINLYQLRIESGDEDKLEEIIEKTSSYDSVEYSVPNHALFSSEIQGIACSFYGDRYPEEELAAPYKMIGLELGLKYLNAAGIDLQKVQVGIVDQGLNDELLLRSNNVDYSTIADKDISPSGNTHGSEVANVISTVAGDLDDKLSMKFTNIFDGSKRFTLIDNYDVENPTHAQYQGVSFVVQAFVEMQKQIKSGSKVINYSANLKPTPTSDQLVSEIYTKYLSKIAKDHPDVLFVASAGNNSSGLTGKNDTIAGNKLPNVITVGGINNLGGEDGFSNYETGNGEVTLSASSTVHTYNDQDNLPEVNYGTSFSAPQVTATAAILKSINPDLNASDIKKIIVDSANSGTPVEDSPDEEYPIPDKLGGKLLRIDKAILIALNSLPEDQRPENITSDYLLQLSEISATAQLEENTQNEYQIEVNLEAVRKDGTEVDILVEGDGFLSGTSSKTIKSPGSLVWDFTMPQTTESTTSNLLITRKDTKACTRLVFSSRGNKYAGMIKMDITYGGETLITLNLDADIKINSDNTVDMKFYGSDRLTVDLGEGDSVPYDYEFTIDTTGTINDEDEIQTTGTYTFSYAFILSGDAAQLLGDSLSDSATGKAHVTGKLEDGAMTGTINIPDPDYPISTKFEVPVDY